MNLILRLKAIFSISFPDRKDGWFSTCWWVSDVSYSILRTGVESPRCARRWKHTRSLQDSVCKRKCVVMMEDEFAALGITQREPRGPIINPCACFHPFSPRASQRNTKGAWRRSFIAPCVYDTLEVRWTMCFHCTGMTRFLNIILN